MAEPLPHVNVKLFFGRWRDDVPEDSKVNGTREIPSFDGTFVHVIDAVHVHVLYVPAEAGVEHAHIYPWTTYSADLLRTGSDYLKEGLWTSVDVIQVERVRSARILLP